MMRASVKKNPPLMAFASFCLIFFASLPFNHMIFTKYLVEPSTKFDLNFYLNIARRGYESEGETAFYPLWPMLMAAVQSAMPDNLQVQAGNLLSLLLFALSLLVVWRLCQRIMDRDAASWVVFLFALNPNSIFHALGYPESFFSLLSAIYLVVTLEFFERASLKNTLCLALTAALMGASRPIILQFASAGAASVLLAAILFRTHEGIRNFLRQAHVWFLLSLGGLVLGYLPYGIYCHTKFQDFLAPFSAQKHWDRKFGLYWSLLTNPKSVSSSDNILTWDIQAFYLPSVLLLVLLYTFWRKNGWLKSGGAVQREQPLHVLMLALCLLIAAAHSAIAFLTYPIFMSLGRHVFATPFFFVGAVAVIFAATPEKPRRYLLGVYLFVSIVYLLNFWTRFGNSAWMG